MPRQSIMSVFSGKDAKLSLPYMHPICPMNASHGRIFVVADTLARYLRAEGYKVHMPIASHYSGNTAHKLSNSIRNSLNGIRDENSERVYNLFTKFYRVPLEILPSLTDPKSLLDYFEKSSLDELKAMNITADFNNYYNTTSSEFVKFVRSVFSQYNQKGLIVSNLNGKTLNYEDHSWRQSVFDQLKRTEVYSREWRNILNQSCNLLDNNWSYERDEGIGVSIEGKIVDPMYDSELYTQFDALNSGFKLPIDMLFAEEHLKNWIAKKVYSETALLPESDRTKSYFILGMGRLNNRKMSASRGHSILVQDLVKQEGSLVTRLALLLTSHPQEHFEWDISLVKNAKRSAQRFKELYRNVCSMPREVNPRIANLIKESKSTIDFCIDSGDFRMAAVQALNVFPNCLRREKISFGVDNSKDYLEYCENIFLPGLFRSEDDLSRL